jgi:hypothetical protein
VLAVAGASLGCDQGSPKVSDGRKGPPPTVVGRYPDRGGTGATNGSIRVQFDRFLASDTANRQGFCVSHSANRNECLAAGSGSGDVTFNVEYDPVDRVVVLKPPPKGLDVGMYTVRVLAPKNSDDTTGIRAFDGVPMAAEDSWDFSVDPNKAAEEPNRKIDFCAEEQACPAPMGDAGIADQKPVTAKSSVQEIVHGTCAAEGACHMPPDEPGKTLKILIGEAVIFGDPDPQSSAVQIKRIISQHQVAPQTATDPDPGLARTSGDTFGRNMPLIDPKNPGNSYILYKMIIGMVTCPGGGGADPSYCSGDGGTYGGSATFMSDFYAADAGACTDTVLHHAGDLVSFPSWLPGGLWHPAAEGEYERLRYHIRGLQMPQGSAAAPYDIHLLSAWIANGAPTANCP